MPICVDIEVHEPPKEYQIQHARPSGSTGSR